MGKTINHRLKPYIIALLVLLVWLLLFLCSCSEVKKNQKALDRVETNPELLRSAFARGLELYPCATDTTFITKQGKVDSIPYNVLIKIDTTNRSRVKDSLLSNILQPLQDICNEKIKSAYDLGVSTATNEFAKIKIPIKAPDTIGGVVVDRRLVKSLADTIIKKELIIAGYNGVLSEVRTNLSEQKKETNKWKWYFYLSIAGLIASHVLRSYIPSIKFPKFGK